MVKMQDRLINNKINGRHRLHRRLNGILTYNWHTRQIQVFVFWIGKPLLSPMGKLVCHSIYLLNIHTTLYKQHIAWSYTVINGEEQLGSISCNIMRYFYNYAENHEGYVPITTGTAINCQRFLTLICLNEQKQWSTSACLRWLGCCSLSMKGDVARAWREGKAFIWWRVLHRDGLKDGGSLRGELVPPYPAVVLAQALDSGLPLLEFNRLNVDAGSNKWDSRLTGLFCSAL